MLYPKVITAALLAATALTACGGGTESPATKVPRITIGHVGHDHQIALFIAALRPSVVEEVCGISLVPKKEREVYDLVKDGKVLAELHLSKVGGGSKMPAAMERGEIDVGLGGIPAVIFFVDKGAPFKILSPLNVDGDMLLLRPDLPVDDWAGFVRYVKESEVPVKIGYKAPVAVAKLVLEGALDAEGIPHGERWVPGGVELVNCRGGGKIVPSLEKGMIDGAVINEPFGSIAVNQKAAKIVSLLADLPPEGRWKNHPCCCIAATDEAIAKNRPALKALLELVHHTTVFIGEHPEEASKLAAEWTRNDLEVEAMSVPNIVYTTDPGETYRAGLRTWLETLPEADRFEGTLAGKSWEECFEATHDLDLYHEMMERR
jgi:NitT/TauT family transport system substrate-binding protein